MDLFYSEMHYESSIRNKLYSRKTLSWQCHLLLNCLLYTYHYGSGAGSGGDGGGDFGGSD